MKIQLNKQDIVFVAEPRSGLTYLRFLMVNIFFPEEEHDYDSVHRLIPSLNSREMEIWNPEIYPRFFKTHDMAEFPNTVLLIRDVKDVVISQWWYMKKFYDETRDLETFVKSYNYGERWRQMVEYYKKSSYIRYEDLISPAKIEGELMVILTYIWNKTDLDISVQTLFDRIPTAVKKCSFDNIKKIELYKGFGSVYTNKNPQIPFVRKGMKMQWMTQLSDETVNMLNLKNETYLKKYGYL